MNDIITDFNAINFIGYLFGYYLIPGTSLVDSIIAIIYLIILRNCKIVKLKRYNLLFLKILVAITMTSILIGCQNCTYYCQDLYNPYVLTAYKLYILRYGLSVLWSTFSLIEALIVYDRYCKLKEEKNVFFTYLKEVSVCLIFLFISIFVWIPLILTHNIKYSEKHKNYYYDFVSDLFKNIYYYYVWSVLGVAYAITLIRVCLYNVLIIREYQKFIRKKTDNDSN